MCLKVKYSAQKEGELTYQMRIRRLIEYMHLKTEFSV